MKCEAVQELLMEYALGELSEAQREDVNVHLEACPACRKSYEEISGALGTLDEWEVPPAGPDLTARTLDALEREREESG
jgi:anti-sigma factor RsiW